MARQYTHVGRSEFESFLSSFAAWDEVDLEDTKERVYRINLPSDDHDVLIFSTVVGDSSRGHGEDAIRAVVWDWDLNRPVSGRRKTLRIGPTDSNPDGWKGNLKPKIESLMVSWRDYVVECPACGAGMVKHDGEYGEFFGCSRYPACDETVNP